MADLIINVNLAESRKKQGLVIETYVGTIPHLKSAQFSGQLRNINLSSVSSVDNLSSIELQNVKDVFSNSCNTQVSKNQYLFSNSLLSCLKSLVNQGCVFCKNKRKSPMYKINQLLLNTGHTHLEHIYNFSVLHEETVLYIDNDLNEQERVTSEIVALFYVNLAGTNYSSELFFDYGSDLINSDDKEIWLGKGAKYRDYGFEKNIISLIKDCHWRKRTQDGYFTYFGKDIANDICRLYKNGIRLFTNEHKRITVARFENIHVGYDIDWFEISGTVVAGDIEIKIGDLIDFRKGRESWVEYDGQLILLPLGFKQVKKHIIEKDGANLRISKEDILGALEVIDLFNSNEIDILNQSSMYNDIHLQLPKELNKILRDYQKVGVKWLISLQKKGFGGCLADDMGLGKTLQIISYISDKSQSGANALIVVPKTLTENWKREFRRFAPNISTYIYHGNGRNLVDALKCRAIITTYGTLINDIKELSECSFDNLIIDEAQNIKNSRSKGHRAIKEVNAKTRIIMTGTPLENNIQEYWGLMKIVNPTNLSYKAITRGLTDEKIIEKVRRLTDMFLLRRTKKEVLDDIPEKEEHIIFCSLDYKQRQLYQMVLESVRNEIERNTDRYEMKSNSLVLSGLLYLQEICCHPLLIPKEYNPRMCCESAKFEQLLLMLNDLLSNGHKIIIFSRFTRMLKIIQNKLIRQHITLFYLDGETRDRQQVVDDFESSKEGVFLISLKAGGVGLNLVSADTAIIYDPWWNPAVEKQAEDRIYRIGQKNKVTIFKLIVANTIEEKVQLLQERKKKLFDDVIEGHCAPRNITMEDIRALLY